MLLPAFVIGMLMKHRDHDTPAERRASTGISFLFMLLVGMSMPLVTGSAASDDPRQPDRSPPRSR